MIIAGKNIEVVDTWVEGSYLQIVNNSGVCFHVLSNSEVNDFSDDSYICTNTEVNKSIKWGDFEFDIPYRNGAKREYKGRDSGDISNFTVFGDYEKGLPTNDYYMICENWEWLYYNERKGRDCVNSANGTLLALGIDYVMTEEDVVNLYNLLHEETPTNKSLNIEDDKEKLLFSVEVEDADNTVSDRIETIDKKWGELVAGDWIHNMCIEGV